jgi:hypothetical protein
MMAGLASMGSYIEDLDDEFRFWWDYFDFPDAQGSGDYTGLEGSGDASGDTCVTIQEFEDGLGTAGDVEEETIINYWIDYYYTTYQITAYYWWIYHTRNGGFDWEAYALRVADGPAFDGTPMLYQIGDGDSRQWFGWFMHNECYFCLDEIDTTGEADTWYLNSLPNNCGTCEIPGHKSIGHDVDYSILEVKMYFNGNEAHANNNIYGLGEWGPAGQHTDLKFYSAADLDYQASWLWERTEEYCHACGSDGSYPPINLFGEGTEAVYYDEYYYETDSYSFGSFDATNQYTEATAVVNSEEITTTTEVVEEPIVEEVIAAPEEVIAPEPFDYGLDYYDEEYF